MPVAPPFFQFVSWGAFLNSTWVEGLKGVLYVTWVLFQFMCTAPATRGSLHECSRNYVALAWYPLGNICTQGSTCTHLGSTENASTCTWFYLPQRIHTLSGIRMVLDCRVACTAYAPKPSLALAEYIVILVILVWLFSMVSFQMCLQILWTKGCMSWAVGMYMACTLYAPSSSLAMAVHTVILVTSFSQFSRVQSAFWNVSSNYMNNRMYTQ